MSKRFFFDCHAINELDKSLWLTGWMSAMDALFSSLSGCPFSTVCLLFFGHRLWVIPWVWVRTVVFFSFRALLSLNAMWFPLFVWLFYVMFSSFAEWARAIRNQTKQKPSVLNTKWEWMQQEHKPYFILGHFQLNTHFLKRWNEMIQWRAIFGHDACGRWKGCDCLKNTLPCTHV